MDVAGARTFVDDIIALGSKWTGIENFSPFDFFREMFVKPSTKASFVTDDISQTKKQLVHERNHSELTLIDLKENIDCLAGEIFETKQCLAELET